MVVIQVHVLVMVQMVRVLVDDVLLVWRTHARHVQLILLLHPLLVLFPLLGAPILEPNLDLSLAQAQILRQFRLPPDRDVLVIERELFLELDPLVVRVYDSVFVLCASLA